MKLLIVLNCQAIAFKKCVEYYSVERVEVDAVSIGGVFEAGLNFSCYDAVVASSRFFDEASRRDDAVFSSNAKLYHFEPISFSAFHPDIAYVMSGGKVVKTPMGDYSSIIVLAGYLKGLAPKEVLDLFSEDFYRDLGYFDLWQQEAELFASKYRFLCNDPQQMLQAISASQCFMYTINHPKLDLIAALAVSLIKHIGLSVHDIRRSPEIPDYLAGGPAWPIYPELASLYGVYGDYLFKSGDSNVLFTLKEFIAGSFESYSEAEIRLDNISVSACGDRYAHALEIMEMVYE